MREREHKANLENKRAKRMNETTFYWKGDLARYTGRTERLYGGTFYEAELLEGHRKGQLILTTNAPN